MKCFPCLLADDSSKRVIESLASPTKIPESKQKMQHQNMISKKDIITRILMDNQNIYYPKFGDQVNSSSKTIIEITPNIPKSPRRISKQSSDISESNKRYTSSYRKQMVNTLRQIPNRRITNESIFTNYGPYSQLNMKHKNDLTNLTTNIYKNNEILNNKKNAKKNININMNLVLNSDRYLSYINNNQTFNTVSYDNSPIKQKINIYNKLEKINRFSKTQKKINILTKYNYILHTSPTIEINTTKSQYSKKQYLSLNKNLLTEFLEKTKQKVNSYKTRSTKHMGLYQVRNFFPKIKKNNYMFCQSLIHLNSNSLEKINPFLSPKETLVRTHTNISSDFNNISSKFRNYDLNTNINLTENKINNISNKKNQFNKANNKLKNRKKSQNLEKVGTGKIKIQIENSNTVKNSEKMKTKFIKKLENEKKLLLAFIYMNKNGKKGKVHTKNKVRIKNNIKK